MASSVFSPPLDLAVAGTTRWMTRHLRLTVPLLMLLICGSFAAAALLQMRTAHAQAVAEALHYESRRAADLAAVTAAALNRLAEAGALYAGDPAAPLTQRGLLNIAVFDADGTNTATLHPDSAMPLLPPAAKAGKPSVFRFGPEAALAFRSGVKIIMVLFEPDSLAPASLRAHAVIGGDTAILDDTAPDATLAPAAVPGWPLTAAAVLDDSGALGGWAGTLPLSLFVILGPAIAGAWLAALLVGSFERQQKSAQAIRALKATRPAEAKLLVRLAEAERAAVEGLRAKSEFIAHMSHELRTPLNAVIGFSEVIEKGLYGPAGHPKYTEYARDIAAAGRGLHACISDVLEFANIEAGRYPIALAAVELSDVATAMVDEHQGRAFSRRITLQTGLAEPSLVRADVLALRRILGHLIDNALAYTGEGGRVLVEVRADENCGLLRISDTGCGFSEAERRKATNAFQRFDRPGSLTGAGLGLAIAMELTRRMGGSMRLPAAEQGAAMELRLPQAAFSAALREN